MLWNVFFQDFGVSQMYAGTQVEYALAKVYDKKFDFPSRVSEVVHLNVYSVLGEINLDRRWM